jgi:hypothetical protein
MILTSLYYLSLLLSLLTLPDLTLLTLLRLSHSPQTLSYPLHSSYSLKTSSFSNFLRFKNPPLAKKRGLGKGGVTEGRDFRDS